ncbi:HXXEE domain-containing protein [Glycomyces terrestris]|uniref:HXXEE domain-containing protein n=1 Tax=Glycomyces terrestris TaxID=2493553 RepID=A0A426V342_9ACTN|nr:HXXEE domain-containing protein [Glycomyces terrestris]RRS01276.1 HXXEE domain-containing protein [Glycomyces terrestris]
MTTESIPQRRVEPYSAIVMGVLAAGFAAWALLALPLQGAFILTLASVLGWTGWITFSYKRPVKSRKVIATYLCAVGFQLIHMAEEYTGGFPHEIVELFDSPRDWPEEQFLLVFVFGFGALYFFAGAGALYRIRAANFFLWWYALGAGLLNGISHFVFPVIKGGYFPGLYTAGGHLVMSALLIYFLIQEHRKLKREDEPG